VTHPPDQPRRPEATPGSGAGGSGNGWPGAGGPSYRPGPPGSVPPVPPPATTPGIPAPGQQPGAPLRPRPQQQPEPGRPVSAPGSTSPVAVGSTAKRKGGRRARLVVRRIDPWSTLKFSFVYSLAGLVVLLVAVIALYAIVDAMGVIDSIRTFLNDIEGKNSSSSIAQWLGFGRVMTVALVVGGVNVILFTAFATLTAFVYNVCTDLVGGIEVTLADRT
jgi:hypothetical protein